MEIMNQIEQLKQKKLLMLCVTIVYGFGSSIFFGVPIWFQSPKTKCFDPKTQTQYTCPEMEACKEFELIFPHSTNYTSIIDEQSQNSLAFQYQLICKRQHIKYDCINIIFAGMLIAYIFNASIRINLNKHKLIFLKHIYLLMGVSLWLQNLFDDVYLKSVCLGLLGFGRIACHTTSIDMFFSFYPENISQFAPLSLALGFGVYGLLILPINLIFDGNFTYCIMFDACPTIICALIFYLKSHQITPDPEKIDQYNEDEMKNRDSPFQFLLKDAFELLKGNNQIQFLVMILNGVYMYITCTGVYFLADYFESPITVIFILNILAVISILFSGYIQVNFNIQNAYFHLMNISIVINLLSVFFPPSLQKTSSLAMFFLFINANVNSFITNIHQLQFILLIPFYQQIKFIGFFVNFCNLLARVILMKLPYVQYKLRYESNTDIMIYYGVASLILNILNYIFMRNKTNSEVPEQYEHLKSQSFIRQTIAIRSIEASHYSNSIYNKEFQDSLKQCNMKGNSLDIKLIQLKTVNKQRLMSEILP